MTTEHTPEDITLDGFPFETDRYHGSASRPPAEARHCGSEHRRRYLRTLRNAANRTFGKTHFSFTFEEWNEARKDRAKVKRALPWATLQVRPEVTVVLKMLQARHIKNTGKEISQSEALNALMAAGLPSLLRCNSSFGEQVAEQTVSTNHPAKDKA